MVAFLITVLAVALLVGIVYLLLQRPQLLAAGTAISLGVIFATLPLIVSMAPFFAALVFGAGAVGITYGIMAINAYRQGLELQQEVETRVRLEQAHLREQQTAAEEGVARRGRSADPDFDDEDGVTTRRSRLARMSNRLGPGAEERPERTAAPRGTDSRFDDLEPGRRERATADQVPEREERADRGRRYGGSHPTDERTEWARSLKRLARRR